MIKKVILEIGGKEIKLTLAQAKELQEILNDTFGSAETVFVDRWHYNHWHNPPQPYWYNTVPCAEATRQYNAAVGWQGSVSSGTLMLKC